MARAGRGPPLGTLTGSVPGDVPEDLPGGGRGAAGPKTLCPALVLNSVVHSSRKALPLWPNRFLALGMKFVG